MATSSIFSTVVIDTQVKAERFIEALEKAQRFPNKDYSQTAIPFSTETSDDLRKKFNAWQERHRQ